MEVRYAKCSLYQAALFLTTMAFGGLTTTAQTLFVADTEFTDQITEMQSVLTAAGVTYTTYNVANNGGLPPSYAQLDANERVIWYTGTDGTELAFWFAEADIRNYAETGKKLWIIGQDLLYAVYPTPTFFGPGDLAYDIMGLETYGVQAYGDDGNEGCPQMDVDPSVAAYFAPTLTWIFQTLWWADGILPLPEIQPIYNMGPANYVLSDYTSMVHNRDPGVLNVMSTLFEPTYISTPAARAAFVQQTLAYMDLNVGVNELSMQAPELRLSTNPANDRVEVICNEAMRSVQVFGADGREVFVKGGLNALSFGLELDGFSNGIYLVRVGTAQDRTATVRLVKQ